MGAKLRAGAGLGAKFRAGAGVGAKLRAGAGVGAKLRAGVGARHRERARAQVSSGVTSPKLRPVPGFPRGKAVGASVDSVAKQGYMDLQIRSGKKKHKDWRRMWLVAKYKFLGCYSDPAVRAW